MKMGDCHRFVDRSALVTGAAQGIGFATCMRLGLEGARVFVVDRAQVPAKEAAERLREHGIDAQEVVVDLASLSGAREAVSQVLDQAGKIDVLVNNVGGTIWKKPFWTYSEEEIFMEIERSFWPTLWMCRAAIPSMVRRSTGSIVNISSSATHSIFRIPYSASKGAVNAMTTSLAVELTDYNIRVNAVSPGTTQITDRKTDRAVRPPTNDELGWDEVFFKYMAAEGLIPRASTVEEQAAVIAFLASDDASYVTGEIIETCRHGQPISRICGVSPQPPEDDMA